MAPAAAPCGSSSCALRGAAAADRRTRVIVTHLHLAPAALPFVLRGASLTTMLCGVEAWRPREPATAQPRSIERHA